MDAPKIKETVVTTKTVTLELTPDEAFILWEIALYHDGDANWRMTHESGNYVKSVTSEAKTLMSELRLGLNTDGLFDGAKSNAYKQRDLT